MTNALISIPPLSANASATISASLAFAGSKVSSTSPLTVRLVNDCFQFQRITQHSNVVAIEFVDRPGKRVAIDYANLLSDPITWLSLQTSVIPTTTTLVISNTVPTNAPQRFYRAREVP